MVLKTKSDRPIQLGTRLNPVRLLVKTENDRKTGQTLQIVGSTGITGNWCI